MRSRKEILYELKNDIKSGGYSQYLIEITKIEILLDIRDQNQLIIEHLKNKK